MTPPHTKVHHLLDLDVALLRDGLEALVQVLIEVETSAFIAAVPHERSTHRRTYRNGYRRRTLSTSVGTVICYIPKLRKGSYYPSFLEVFRQHESTLLNSLRDLLEHGISFGAIQSIAHAVGIETAKADVLADGVERLYDLTHRLRSLYYQYVPSRSDELIAISTQQINATVTNRSIKLPLAILDADSVAMLDESLQVLLRVRQALSDSLDAVGLAA